MKIKFTKFKTVFRPWPQFNRGNTVPAGYRLWSLGWLYYSIAIIFKGSKYIR